MGPGGQNPFVVAVRRSGGVHRLGLSGGGQAGERRLPALAGQLPMPREDRRVDVGRPGREQLRDEPMELAVSAGRDVVVYRLPQKIVAEPVAGCVDHHEVRVPGSLKRDSHHGSVQAERVGNHRLVARVGHSHDLQRLDCSAWTTSAPCSAKPG